MVVYVPATQEKDLQKVILALQQLAAGRSNATGTGNTIDWDIHGRFFDGQLYAVGDYRVGFGSASGSDLDGDMG